LPQGIRRVFVPVFTNHTQEPHVEAVFTQMMRDQVAKAGAEADAHADARLLGDVLRLVSTTGMTLNNVQYAPPVYRVGVTLRVRLMKGGAVVAQADVEGTEDYLSAGGNILATESNRQAAIARLALTLSQDGYNRLAGGF
jgi:hypothetical protein